ncbi:reverse transcriptase [Trichonephila clavipes]|uniref:Reverse transcriptase n=1 Tax=Trichonephila clavipes TaxID=2585209 RepID=A0A8X6WA53_TRICX|nr:reverse transcriptase [Trichonephila clavipes]
MSKTLNTIQGRTKIAELISYGRTVALHRIPSHVGDPVTERADQKAKQGAVSTLPENPLDPQKRVYHHSLGMAANEACPICGHARMEGDNLLQCTGLDEYLADEIVCRYWKARCQMVKKRSTCVGKINSFHYAVRIDAYMNKILLDPFIRQKTKTHASHLEVELRKEFENCRRNESKIEFLKYHASHQLSQYVITFIKDNPKDCADKSEDYVPKKSNRSTYAFADVVALINHKQKYVLISIY